MSQISPLLLLRNGIAAAKAGNRAQARQVLLRVTELDSNNELAWLWLASVAETLIQAKHYLQRVLDINPANAEAIRGKKMVDAKLAEVAPHPLCPFCQSLLAGEDQCSNCHAILALAHSDRLFSNTAVNEPVVRGALAMYQTAARDDDKNFTAHYHLGLGFLNLRQLDRGLYHLQKAQQIHSEDRDLKRQVDLLVQRHATARQTTPNTTMPNSAHQKKILVVDDSPTICKLVTLTLEKHGYRVISAPDGLEGLAKLNDVRPSLILLDITMPRMDGYQLCRIVKGNSATLHIPVVMLSGKDGFFDKVRGRAAGATDYVTKPFEPDTLLQIVQKYLDQSPRNDSKSQTNLDGDQEKAVRSVA